MVSVPYALNDKHWMSCEAKYDMQQCIKCLKVQQGECWLICLLQYWTHTLAAAFAASSCCSMLL